MASRLRITRKSIVPEPVETLLTGKPTDLPPGASHSSGILQLSSPTASVSHNNSPDLSAVPSFFFVTGRDDTAKHSHVMKHLHAKPTPVPDGTNRKSDKKRPPISKGDPSDGDQRCTELLYAETFFRDEIITHALTYEPLMNAVAGFAAYHFSFHHPNDESHLFRRYYNKSVSGLSKSLESGKQCTEAMLLTILQLATFEEYLGEWRNLVYHIEEARRLLVELYNPETVNQDYFHRHIFMWYSRFDLMIGPLCHKVPCPIKQGGT
ncbi:hypothetical protein AJ80_09964 [Polytolypa hystricis UAMH7299]|uniref:Uncharacterized protein n=1 Tax=Polytolypa hystricis (strain UAMH7299) TaxID=1447883 RepID=A0A2B7WFQ4_POLH7|nr:hypothetical protein AJ80_09964 [Polytolypa hystricis UAMH7299]